MLGLGLGLALALARAGPAPTAEPARSVPSDSLSASVPTDSSAPAPTTIRAEPAGPAPVPEASLPTPVPEASPVEPGAQGRPIVGPMRVRLALDLPVIALGMSVALGIELIAAEQRWAGCGACSGAGLNALDRTVLGKHDPRARTYSDIGMVAMVALPFALDLGDVLLQRARDRSTLKSRHLRGWGRDVVVLLETFAVNYAATNLVKIAVQRPRPYSYDPDSRVGDPQAGDARLSFFSGHSSTSFAMAAAYASLFQARHPRSRWVAPVWVLGLSLASTVAVARVEAGKHFWTDVIVGAVAGTSIGVLVPALHRSERLGERLALRLAPTRHGSLLVMQGRF
jgi:membrane-associated phospholipid phosphatase